MTPTTIGYEDLAQAVKIVSASCDGAHALDGTGFSACDAVFGNSLALLPAESWDSDIATAAWGMLSHYRKQLSEGGVIFDDIPAPGGTDPLAGRDRAIRETVTARSNDKVGRDSTFSVNGGLISLFSPYNKELVSDCRDIAGRAWDAGRKTNTFPVEAVLAVRDLAAKWGMTLPQPVLDLPVMEMAAPVVHFGVEKVGREIEVRFAYDPTVVNSVHHVIPSAAFRQSDKVWVTVEENVGEAIEFAKKHGLTIQPGLSDDFDLMVASRKELHDASLATEGSIQIDSAMELHPFQKAGVEYLLKARKAILGDEMGLGKSAQALATIVADGAFPAVIVCPATLKGVWVQEVAKFFPHLSVNVLSGTKTQPWFPADITIANYDIVYARVDDLIAINPKALVCDESHRIANGKAKHACPECGMAGLRVNSKRCPQCKAKFDAPAEKWTVKRTEGVIRISRSMEGDALKLLLTGTPINNRPIELVSQLIAIDRIDEFGGRWRFQNRYCFPENAPILMADWTYKPLSDVAVGDKVIGWDEPPNRGNKRRAVVATVEATHRYTDAPLQTVTLDDGESLICTPDHKWLTGRYGIVGKKHSGIGYRALATEGAASEMIRVMPVDFESDPADVSETYMDGYTVGYFRGDGWATLTKSHRHSPFRNTNWVSTGAYTCGASGKMTNSLDRIEKHLVGLAIPYNRCVSANGMTAIKGTGRLYDFVTQEPGDSDEWWSGFLGGIYDAEGSRACIHQYEEKNPITYKMIMTALDRFGFGYSAHKSMITLLGGKDEFLRFWQLAVPVLHYKLEARLNTKMARRLTFAKPNVTAIDPLPGAHVVRTLTTTTGNYVAYGLASKNCPGTTGATNLVELNKKLRQLCFCRRKKADIYTELPPLVDAPVPLEIGATEMARYAEIERDVVEFMANRAREIAEEAGEDGDAVYVEKKIRLEAVEHLVRINGLKTAISTLKYSAVVRWIEDFLADSDEKLIVMGEHISMIEKLSEHFGPKVSVKIRGGVSQKARMEAVDRFQNDPNTRLFIGSSIAASEGLTLTAASNIAMIEHPWTPSIVAQCAARAWGRVSDLHGCTLWHLVCPNTIDIEILALLEKKKVVVDAATDGVELDGKQGSVLGDLLVSLARRGGGMPA